MKYIDMHCDTLTESYLRKIPLDSDLLQCNFSKLKNSNCVAQCFAIFTQGKSAINTFFACLDSYEKGVKENSIKKILSFSDLNYCIKNNILGSILTVEDLGLFENNLEKVLLLGNLGVRMASLVWNYENNFAYPNLIFKDNTPNFLSREFRGLKNKGAEIVDILDCQKIIIDISHLSDGGVSDILKNRKIPIVASHSNTQKVCNVSRNLTDELIKKIANCGGIIGVNFCKAFLGDGENFNLVLQHIKHLIKIGGEEVIAFGSDFDGIPQTQDIENCLKMPLLIEYLQQNGIKDDTLEKLCYLNFARVFKEVCS